MTADDFRAALAEVGLVLEGPAFEAALKGAQHLREEIARLDRFLAEVAA